MTLTQINKAGLDELALDHVFTIGASGSSAYTFQGEGLNGTVNNPTLYLTRGKTYRFENGSGGHPIRIQSTSGASGTAYNTGVTNNAGSGTVIVEVQHDAPDVLYYQCTSHAAMNGILYVTGALSDGSVTTAKLANGSVTTAKLASDAVTQAKIADDAVGQNQIADDSIVAAHIANNNVTTAKIASDAVTSSKIADSAVNSEHINDQAVTLAKLPHGTSSNDGKFLRANNGADPTFETVSGTTINNNADNRVITGSGTANTLNGESNVVIDANGKLGVGTTSPQRNVEVIGQLGVGNSSGAHWYVDRSDSNGNFELHQSNSTANDGEKITVKTTGEVGIGTTNPSYELDVRGSAKANLQIKTQGTGANDDAFLRMRVGGSAQDCWIDFGDVDDADVGYIRYSHSGDHMMFAVNGGEKVRIRSTGGITFNGDTAEANALDDYEEGTYSPTLTGYGSTTSFTLYSSEDTLSYVKIGNNCWINGRIRINDDQYSGYVRMTLPFTSAQGTDCSNCGMSAVATHGVTFSDSIDKGLFFETYTNATFGVFVFQREDTGWTNATNAHITGNNYITFNHHYITQ